MMLHMIATHVDEWYYIWQLHILMNKKPNMISHVCMKYQQFLLASLDKVFSIKRNFYSLKQILTQILAKYLSFLKSFSVLWCLDNLEKLQNIFYWLIYFCLFFFSIVCAWSLQRLEMLSPEPQFLPSHLVYDTKIEQSVTWLLQRLKMLN